MKDSEDEDEKEGIKFKKPNKEEIDLGLYMIDKFLNNDDFMDMASKLAKNINMEQLVSNMVNDPILKDFNLTPFNNANNNNDNGLEIAKYNLEKIGFSENEQNEFMENYMKILKNPKLKDITIDINKIK